ncbi:MAG TPA: TlpA disulfide reductase family protein [Kofleriaceae bacterium]|nr:TlpA disulfide reductase family protein [Kofleriaceae bacterium]
MVESPQQPKHAIVLDPVVLVTGGAIALIGVAVLAVFLWMVPRAANREVRAACAALHPSDPNPALCPVGNEHCRFPMPAPDFTAYDHNGKPVHLSDFRGKVVLLNFWASWCGVCKMEKPQINGMAGDLTGDDFEVIALASDRSWSDVLVALVDSLTRTKVDGKDESMGQALELYHRALPDGVPFQVFLDKPQGDDNIGEIAASWGIKAVPESALIDRQGNIRAYFVNKRDWQSPVAETCLRSLIDEE